MLLLSEDELGAPGNWYNYLVIGEDVLSDPGDVRLYTKEALTFDVENDLKSQLGRIIEKRKLEAHDIRNLSQIMQEVKTDVSMQTFQRHDTGERRASSGVLSMTASYLFGFLIYMFVFMYGVMVMHGVIEEKNSRVLEIIVSSVRPFELMLGKILGIASVALVQFLIWVALILALGTAALHLLTPDALIRSAAVPGVVPQMDAGTLAAIRQVTDGGFLLKLFGGFLVYFVGGYLLYADNDYRYNMLGQLNRTGFSKRTRRYLQGSFKLSHDLDFITKGLSVAAQFSYDTYNQHTINNSVPTHSTSNLTYPGYSTWMLPTEYSIDEWKNNSAYWIQNGSYVTANQRTTDDAQGNSLSHANPEGTSRFQARLDYARKFGDHNVTAMVLYYMQNKIVGKEVPYRYMGFSGRATYDYKNKYLFEFNIGYNGSENFARGHRFGVFPAGSIGWVVSQEEFMKNVRWIDHLKLRASYGLVGNDQMGSTRFAYLQYYTSGSNMNIYFGEDKKAFGTTLIEGIFANPSLTWEKARKFNFGIDAEFFHQRLTLSVDVFKEHRYDILTSLNTDDKLGFPYIVGQTAPIVNSGIVDNRGIEFQLGWDGRIGQHFRYWIRPNFTFARNKVKFCNEISYIDNNGRDCPWRYQTGRRVGENFCYIFDHFVADQDEADRLNAMNGGSGFAIWGPVQPGDVVYKDMNGDGVVNNYDRAAVGNPRTPEIQYGIPVGLSYKGFDFSMLWQGSALCSVQLSGPAVWDFPLYDQSRTGKVRKMHLNRWTPETAATATYPALHYGIHNNNKQQYSSLFLYDASYIRLKNVEIGYTLPKAWTSKAGIQSVRIYAQGQNLLTFDRLGDVDMDPEIKNGDGSWFPVQRVVNLGINMTF